MNKIFNLILEILMAPIEEILLFFRAFRTPDTVFTVAAPHNAAAAVTTEEMHDYGYNPATGNAWVAAGLDAQGFTLGEEDRGVVPEFFTIQW